jgi:DNA-binding IclR family transcriptional regulator
MATLTYPETGTNASTILEYIRDNPNTSRNSIITALDLNSSVVKKVVQSLLKHELITDNPDDRGYHRYSAKGDR